MSDDRRPAQDGLSRLRDDLHRRSHLFDDPGAYAAGVDDAVAALSVDRTDDPAQVARLRASAMGFAIAQGGDLDPVEELGELSGHDPVSLLAAYRQLDLLAHVDPGVRRTAANLLGAALARSPREVAHGHDVTFYRDDDELSETVATFLAPALADEDATAIVVATPEHHDGVLAALAGRDLPGDAHDGYLALDAETLLADLLIDGRPDRARFLAEVVPRIVDLRPHATDVRIYGEMVAVLWARGDVSAAIELEGLWNEAAHRAAFTLLCGYPIQLLDEPAHAGPLREVCRRHGEVLPAAG